MEALAAVICVVSLASRPRRRLLSAAKTLSAAGGVVGGHGVGVLGIEDFLGVLRDGERSARGILHLARGRGTGEARDAAGRGEIHGVRRVGVLIAAENVASLDRGPAEAI